MKAFLIFSILIIFIFEVYNMIFKKRIYLKGTKPIYLSEDPHLFWLNVILFIVGFPLSIFFIFYFFPIIDKLFW